MIRMKERLRLEGQKNETCSFMTTWEEECSGGLPENKGYKGTVNNISMVEADKTGPYATTPLGICMNSSVSSAR
jgi:hypothetical protein